MTSFETLPCLTEGLPAISARWQTIDDFIVEEIPAYLPDGTGQHHYLWIEKRGLTTQDALERLCGRLGISVEHAGAGYAGLKDKHGVTRQWISLDSANCNAEPLANYQDDALRVLELHRHKNKLKTGHLHGNRFVVTLRNGSSDDFVHANAILEVIRHEGLPNYFGPQRFGIDGDNATRGLAMLRGEEPWPRSKFQRKFLVSAAQSCLFNRQLAHRLNSKTQAHLLGGEVLKRRETGGLFVDEETARNQARLDENELVITGAIWGAEMKRPRTDSPAEQEELELLSAETLTLAHLKKAGRIALGTRRELLVFPTEIALNPKNSTAVEIHFTLPSGAYATTLLRELTKEWLAPPSG